jgi:hemerythrin-like domain-containing protein
MQHRYNPFRQIHKGLKAMLYQTAMAIQHNDFSDVYATGHVVDQVQKVLWLFDGHAHTEDSMVFPLIQQHATHIVDEFEKQHEKDHQLSQDVENALDALLQAKDKDERIVKAQELTFAFERFISFNLEHMMMEETVVAPVIWQHYTDAELHGLTAKIVQSLPADKNEHYTDWMLIGNSNPEVINWLNGVKASAPAPVFEGLCERASNILPKSRWHEIEACLFEDLALLN